jgi:hypothetical protein
VGSSFCLTQCIAVESTQPASVSSEQKQASIKKAAPTKATHRLDIFLGDTKLALDQTIFQIVPKPPQGTTSILSILICALL